MLWAAFHCLHLRLSRGKAREAYGWPVDTACYSPSAVAKRCVQPQAGTVGTELQIGDAWL